MFVAIIVFVLAKKDVLFVKPLIRKFSRIMYPDEVEGLEAENVVKDADVVDEPGPETEKGGANEQ